VVLCGELWVFLAHMGDVKLIIKLVSFATESFGEEICGCSLPNHPGCSEKTCDAGPYLPEKFGFFALILFVVMIWRCIGYLPFARPGDDIGN
jgi:hypothetical protein